MKRLLILSLIIPLSGCGTIPLGNDETGKTWADAAIEIAKDPKCGHTDRIDIDLGVVSKGKVFLERACTAPAPAQDSIAKQIEAALVARFGPAPPN